MEPGQLHLTWNRRKLSVETRAKVFPAGWASYVLYWIYIRAQTLLGGLLMGLGISTGDVRWGEYKKAFTPHHPIVKLFIPLNSYNI